VARRARAGSRAARGRGRPRTPGGRRRVDARGEPAHAGRLGAHRRTRRRAGLHFPLARPASLTAEPPRVTRRVAILPDAVADQIAAGEVVERPAAVVKELVENAIDAGARHVRVRVEEGGKSLVEVGDDGSGMGREDAVLAIERHATSKIRAASDLVGVATFGFRGEALPAIASVSRFALVT